MASNESVAAELRKLQEELENTAKLPVLPGDSCGEAVKYILSRLEPLIAQLATPDPALEELRKLVINWRDWNSTKMTPITCADELEQLLNRAAKEQK